MAALAFTVLIAGVGGRVARGAESGCTNFLAASGALALGEAAYSDSVSNLQIDGVPYADEVHSTRGPSLMADVLVRLCALPAWQAGLGVNISSGLTAAYKTHGNIDLKVLYNLPGGEAGWGGYLGVEGLGYFSHSFDVPYQGGTLRLSGSTHDVNHRSGGILIGLRSLESGGFVQLEVVRYKLDYYDTALPRSQHPTCGPSQVNCLVNVSGQIRGSGAQLVMGYRWQ